jgi:hypothetical protein
MSTNPFVTEEAWAVSSFLPAGDHVCKVLEIDGEGNSSGQHPQIEIKVGNMMGEIRDWIVVIPATIGKVIQFTDAVGLRRPTDEEVTPEGTGYRLDPKYLALAVDQEVGVMVRAEPDRNDPSKTRDRVKGYVDAAKIKPSDLPSSTNVASSAPTVVGEFSFPSAVKSDDDIPFAPSVV